MYMENSMVGLTTIMPVLTMFESADELRGWGLTTIMPILAVTFTLIVIVVVIITFGKMSVAKIQAENLNTFARLAKDLKEENAMIQSDLKEIKETIESMNKMMKDI